MTSDDIIRTWGRIEQTLIDAAAVLGRDMDEVRVEAIAMAQRDAISVEEAVKAIVLHETVRRMYAFQDDLARIEACISRLPPDAKGTQD